MSLKAAMEKADEAYDEVLEVGGTPSQAAIAYHVTSKAEKSGNALRIEAARYVTLYQCYLVSGDFSAIDEYFELYRKFHGMRWNYSMVELFAKTGENSATSEKATPLTN